MNWTRLILSAAKAIAVFIVFGILLVGLIYAVTREYGLIIVAIIWTVGFLAWLTSDIYKSGGEE